MARQLAMSVDKAQSFIGTMCYMAPERLRAEGYGFKSDVWSLGLIVYECAAGRFPVGESPARVTVFDFVADKVGEAGIPVELPAGYSPELRDFITRCLRVDVDEREGIETLVEHPWALRYKDESANAALLEWVTRAEETRERSRQATEHSLQKFDIHK
jgi:mitogen-activated protein kinase kinase 1